MIRVGCCGLYGMAAGAVLFGLLSAQPAGAEIYKWVDEAGRTHYGDAIPPRFKAKGNLVVPVPQQPAEPVEPQQPVPPRAETEVKAKAQAPAVAAEAPAPAAQDESLFISEEQYQEEMRKYKESQACFNKYANRNGTFKAEAFRVCPVVKRPRLDRVF